MIKIIMFLMITVSKIIIIIIRMHNSVMPDHSIPFSHTTLPSL